MIYRKKAPPNFTARGEWRESNKICVLNVTFLTDNMNFLANRRIIDTIWRFSDGYSISIHRCIFCLKLNFDSSAIDLIFKPA